MCGWDLYIDETGAFEEGGERVAVAGVVIRDDLPVTSTWLRTTLQQAAPFFPWPLHAAWMNVPIMWALTFLATGERRRDELIWNQLPYTAGMLVDSTRQVAEHFSEIVRAEGRLMTCLTGGGKINLRTIRDLDEQLRLIDRTTYDQLDTFRRVGRSWILAVFEDLVARDQAREGNDSRSIAVLSAETVVGESMGSGTLSAAQCQTVRYLALLECLLERTMDLLEARGTPQKVRVRVLDRGSMMLREAKARGLRKEDIDRLVSKVATPRRWVSMQATEVVPFRGDLHPGFVLADHVANRSRRALRGSRRGLAGLEASLREHIALPSRSGSANLPHPCASGEPRRRVAEARVGTPSVQLAAAGDGVPWAWEQAAEWHAYFVTRRG